MGIQNGPAMQRVVQLLLVTFSTIFFLRSCGAKSIKVVSKIKRQLFFVFDGDQQSVTLGPSCTAAFVP